MSRRSVCPVISIQHASRLSVVIFAALFPDACSYGWGPSSERHSRRVALSDGASLLQQSIDVRERSLLGGHPKKRTKQAQRIERGGEADGNQSRAINSTRPAGSQTFPGNNSNIEKRPAGSQTFPGNSSNTSKRPPQLPVDHLENRTRRDAGPGGRNMSRSNGSRNDTGPEPDLQTPQQERGHAYANASQNTSRNTSQNTRQSASPRADRKLRDSDRASRGDHRADSDQPNRGIVRTSTTSTTTPGADAVATYILYFGTRTTSQDLCDFCHYLNNSAPANGPCLHYGDPDHGGLPIAIVHHAINEFQPVLDAHNYDLLWVEGDKFMYEMSDTDPVPNDPVVTETESMTSLTTETFTSLTTESKSTTTSTRTSLTFTKTSVTTSTTTMTSTLTSTTSTTTSTTNTTTRTSTTGTTTTSTTTIVLTWSLDRIDDRYGFDGSYSDGDAGFGVHIYQFDTGIDWTHQEFSGRALPVMEIDYTSTGPRKTMCPRAQVTQSDSPAPPPDDYWSIEKTDHTEYGDVEHHHYNPFYDDDIIDEGNQISRGYYQCGWDEDGHGTHTASIIMSRTYGVSKNSRLWMYKTTQEIPRTETTPASTILTVAGFLQGLDHALVNQRRPSVFACLFAAPGRSGSMTRAIEHTINGGTLVVVAAGSGIAHADACGFFPSNVPTAFVVSSMDEFDAKDKRANYGPCVDIYAPGTQITAAKYPQLTTTKTGTSMAAAHGAGFAALILSWYPRANPAYLRTAMVTLSMPDVLTSIPATGANVMIYTHRARLFFEIAGTDAKISFMEWWARNQERTYDDALRLFLVVDSDHNMGIDFLEFNAAFGHFT